MRRTISALLLLCTAAGASGCGSDATGLGVDLVSREQLAQLSHRTWQDLRAQTEVSSSAQYRQIADRVARRILEAAGRESEQWEVVAFEGDQANAFTLPGEKIGIYEGMFRVAQNEAQLAAVLAHEVAHIDAGHPSERMSTSMATQLGVDLAGAFLGSDSGLAAALLGAGAQYGINLPFSRNQELEADALGLRYMAKAGYDPREALELWRRMEQTGSGDVPSFLSTHPAPQERLEALQRQLPQAVALYEANYRAAR